MRARARLGATGRTLPLVIALLVVCGGAGWRILDEYVFTIKLHLPIIGEVDTGITRHQLSEFQSAMETYRREGVDLLQAKSSGRITEPEFQSQNTQLSLRALSDRRVTAVTGGPAKQFLKFLLRNVSLDLFP